MATSNGQVKIFQFLGFSGVAALVGLAVMIGNYQNSIDAALKQQAKTQQQITELATSLTHITEAVHMNQYRIAKLEERK